MLGAIFWSQTTLVTIFAQIFRDFPWIFKDCVLVFRDFSRIFDKSKLLRLRLHPIHPCLLHHLFNARSFAMPLAKDLQSTGLHNSESWKGQIININFPRATNIYFISMWRFIVVWKKFWKENCLFDVELSQHFLQLRKPSRATSEALRAACCAGLLQKNERQRLK